MWQKIGNIVAKKINDLLETDMEMLAGKFQYCHDI